MQKNAPATAGRFTATKPRTSVFVATTQSRAAKLNPAAACKSSTTVAQKRENFNSVYERSQPQPRMSAAPEKKKGR